MIPLSIAGSDNYQDVGITTLFYSILIAVVINAYIQTTAQFNYWHRHSLYSNV